MRTLRNISLFILRAMVLLALIWLSFFWIGVLVYSFENLMRGGVRALMGWLFHIFRQPNPDGFGFKPLTVQNVLLRLLGMLAITILLWLANRRLLKDFSSQLRARPNNHRTTGSIEGG